MPELNPAPSINDSRTQALLTLIARLGLLDLGPLLVYRVDSVPASALPFLAWQFDILSPLWQLIAPLSIGVDALTNIDLLIDIDNLIEGGGGIVPDNLTEAAQRDLVKNAIPLHRFRGTPWAVKQALRSLGWLTVSLLEGQNSWGGSSYPSNQGWAVFRAMVNLEEGQAVDRGASQMAVSAINFFKPARAWLDSVWFVTPPISDLAPSPRDLLTLGGLVQYQLDAGIDPSDHTLAIAITLTSPADAYPAITPLHDTHYRYSGITYGANEPQVADSALILNGAANLHGG
jgi:P2-related tail formation protein